jgi:hypothetical protein
MGISVTRCTASHARNLPRVKRRDFWVSYMLYHQYFQCFMCDLDAVDLDGEELGERRHERGKIRFDAAL